MRLCLPLVAIVAATIAYQFGALTVLLGLACIAPVTMLLAPRPRRSAKIRRDPTAIVVEMDSFVSAMDAFITQASSQQKMACIAVAIDNAEDLKQGLDTRACNQAFAETFERIKGVLRSDDLIVQLGGGEFAIFISSLRAPETSAVMALCDRMTDETVPPVVIDGHNIHVTVSAGFCMSAHAPTPSGQDYLEAARAALREAQQNAPGGISAYSKKTRAPIENAQRDAAIRALRDGQIFAWYQPQVSTDTGQITGFEALARWDHPEHGLLLPEAFVPLFDSSNRMEEFGETILNHALQALVAWDKAGLCVPSISVNFATQELRNPSLVERIKWDVERYGLDPERLTVEIVETVIDEREDDIITHNIRALGSQGFRIDLDDFGTGHASLANIRRFCVDRVKIDRSFVVQSDTDPNQQRMIAAIVGLSERLGIETLAEGVETPSELSFLSQIGCTHLQGFAITKPMPFKDTLKWIPEHNARIQQAQIVSKRLP